MRASTPSQPMLPCGLRQEDFYFYSEHNAFNLNFLFRTCFCRVLIHFNCRASAITYSGNELHGMAVYVRPRYNRPSAFSTDLKRPHVNSHICITLMCIAETFLIFQHFFANQCAASLQIDAFIYDQNSDYRPFINGHDACYTFQKFFFLEANNSALKMEL